MEETKLINLAIIGNSKAYKTLYDTHSTKVYNTALSYTQNIEDAEEVTQDVFTNVFLNISKFKGDAKLSTWIYRITVNTSLNLLKKRNRKPFLYFSSYKKIEEISHFDHPGVLLENKEKAQTLFNAIKKLPEKQKTAFILSYIEDLPRQEVANIMENTLKSVEALLQRAKKELRNNLKDLAPNQRKSSN